MSVGQVFAVESTGPQAHHSHVPHGRVWIGNTWQNLKRETHQPDYSMRIRILDPFKLTVLNSQCVCVCV